MCLGKNIKKEVQSQGKITIKSGEQRKSRSKGSRNKSNLRDQKVQLKTHNNRRNEPMLVSVAAQQNNQSVVSSLVKRNKENISNSSNLRKSSIQAIKAPKIKKSRCSSANQSSEATVLAQRKSDITEISNFCLRDTFSKQNKSNEKKPKIQTINQTIQSSLALRSPKQVGHLSMSSSNLLQTSEPDMVDYSQTQKTSVKKSNHKRQPSSNNV